MKLYMPTLPRRYPYFFVILSLSFLLLLLKYIIFLSFCFFLYSLHQIKPENDMKSDETQASCRTDHFGKSRTVSVRCTTFSSQLKLYHFPPPTLSDQFYSQKGLYWLHVETEFGDNPGRGREVGRGRGESGRVRESVSESVSERE